MNTLKSRLQNHASTFLQGTLHNQRNGLNQSIPRRFLKLLKYPILKCSNVRSKHVLGTMSSCPDRFFSENSTCSRT